MIRKFTYWLAILLLAIIFFQCKAKKPLLKDLELEESNSKLKADTLVQIYLRIILSLKILKQRLELNSRVEKNKT